MVIFHALALALAAMRVPHIGLLTARR